jgi:hypothetical protein
MTAPRTSVTPATSASRFAWGLALTPIAGLIGVALYLAILQYGFRNVVPAAPPSPPQRAPLLIEVASAVGLALLSSLLSWPVTLVVFPFVRRRFWQRSWKAFCALLLSAAVTGFVAPGLVVLFIRIFTWGLLSPLDLGLAVTGSGSGFLTAIPYFLLTNPRRSPAPAIAAA